MAAGSVHAYRKRLREMEVLNFRLAKTARDMVAESTERKRIEKELSESKGALRKALDSVDADTCRMKDANQPAIDMLGVTEESTIGFDRSTDICSAGSYSAHVSPDKLYISAQPIETSDVSSCSVTREFVPTSIGGHGCIMESITDITPLITSPEPLRMNDDFMETVLEGIQDGICVLDPDMTVTKINHAAKWLYYGSGSMTGKKCFETVHKRTSPCENCPAAAALRTGTIQSSVIPMPREDEEAGWIEFVAFPMLDENRRVRGVVAYMRDITEKRLHEERMEHLSQHDALTSLPNRLRFGDKLESIIRNARQKRTPLAVVSIDIDRFKVINDTLGHGIGDLLLRDIAERLQKIARPEDVIARVGGDEFMLILGRITCREEIAGVAQDILTSIGRPVCIDGHELFVTASLGIGIFPGDGKNAEELVKNADTAMHKAKEEGRDNFQFYCKNFDSMTIDRMRMQSNLLRAIEQGELEVHYQPRIDMCTNEIEGVEALVRWRNPAMGVLMPDKFIPLAEEIGLVRDITLHVLEKACAQAQSLKEAGYPTVRVAVNVSSQDIQRGDLADKVDTILTTTGLSPQQLELEIAEGSLLNKPEIVSTMIAKLKRLGVKIAIDNFGTRYASLDTLKEFPVDCVKIDRLFVRHVTTDANDAAIVGAIISMAHSMGLKVVAEGIETVSQFEFLQALKCDSIQGYLISRPVPSEELIHLLGENTQVWKAA